MLTLEKENTIRAYIHSLEFIFKEPAPRLHNYATLKEAVLRLELENEIKLLKKMLENLSTFEKSFKEHCKKRESEDYAIPFSTMPETFTNTLYFNIAMELFEPKTQREMLSIIMPSVTKSLKVVWPEEFPKELSTHQYKGYIQNHMEPSFSTENLSDDRQPSLKELSFYAISNNILFDVRKIEKIPLFLHDRLQLQLQKNYYELAIKLYNHNSKFQILSDDIQTYKGKGISPQVAIEQLIKSFTLGGKKITGKEFASDAACDAAERFLIYFEGLHSDIQKELRQLKSGEYNITLGDIIDKEIKEYLCIETSVLHLKPILESNKKNPIFIKPPVLSKESLSAINRKYKNEEMEVRKDALLLLTLPHELTKTIIEKFKANNLEDFVILILNFPTAYYDLLFKYINVFLNKYFIDKFPHIIKLGCFNDEQKEALSTAMFLHFNRFKNNDYETFLHWAISTDDPIFVKKALASLSSNPIKIDILINDAIPYPNSLKSILELFTNDEIHNIVTKPDFLSDSYINLFFYHPESLELILEYIPTNQIFEMIFKNDPQLINRMLENPFIHNKTFAVFLRPLMTAPSLDPNQTDLYRFINNNFIKVINKIIDYPDLLKILLKNKKIPEKKLFETIKKQLETINILHAELKVIKFIFQSLAENSRFELTLEIIKLASLKYDQINNNYRSHKIKIIKTALESLSDDKSRFKIILDMKLYDCFKNFPEGLNTILETLPEDKRFDIINIPDENGTTILHRSVKDLELTKFLIKSFPEDKRFDIINIPDENGTTLLHRSVKNLELFKFLIESLPKNKRLQAGELSEFDGQTVLHLTAANSPEKFITFLKSLDENERLEALSIADSTGWRVIDEIESANCTILFKEILSILPENDRLSYLKIKLSDTTVMNILLARKEMANMSKDNEFKNSFIPDLFIIYRILQELTSSVIHSVTMFLNKGQSKNSIDQLRYDIEHAKDIDEIKKRINEFVKENRSSLFTKKLLENIKLNTIEQLSDRWQLNSLEKISHINDRQHQ